MKFVIAGKPVERDGQTYDYKVLLAEHVRQCATLDDLEALVELLRKARKCKARLTTRNGILTYNVYNSN